MAWLNNANIIATLVLAIFGIAGYIYGIATYLRKRANPNRQATEASSASPAPKTIPSRPLSWLEWIELFAQGFVDTADFIFNLLPTREFGENPSVTNKLGYCAVICGCGVLIGEVILGLAIGIFLSFLGVNNPVGAAVGVSTVLLFMTFSLLYVYHVGLAVEMKQLEQFEQFQEIKKQ